MQSQRHSYEEENPIHIKKLENLGVSVNVPIVPSIEESKTAGIFPRIHGLSNQNIEHFMPHYIHVYIMKNPELILTKNIFPFAKGKPWTGKFDPWHIIP